MALNYEEKEYVLIKQLNEIDKSKATPEEIVELQWFYEDYWPYQICKELTENYHQRACQQRYEIVMQFIMTKMKDGESITTHLQCM